MGDMGDIWREHRAYKAKSKRRYQDTVLPKDLALLNRLEGVSYEILNNGEHYVIDTGKTFVNYWPSTGRWKHRFSKANGFGIKKLKAYFRLKETTDG